MNNLAKIQLYPTLRLFNIGQLCHLSWPILPLFHPRGKIQHEIMAKYPGNAQQQHDIHAGAFEHLVHIAFVTGNLAGKPFHLYALPLQFRRHHLSDVQFLYLLLFCHKKTVNFCLQLRFAKTLTTNKKSPRKP